MSVLRGCSMVFLAVCLSILLCCTSSVGDTEPNGSEGTAEPISAGTHNGTLNTRDPVKDSEDCYSLGYSSGDRIDVSFFVSNPTLNISLLIFYHANDGKAHDVLELTGSTEVRNGYGCLDNDSGVSTLFVEVRSNAPNSTCNYSFTISYTSQMDGGTTGDAPGDSEGALRIGPFQNITGCLARWDMFDYYRIECKPGTDVRFRFISHCTKVGNVSGQRLTLADSSLDELFNMTSHDGRFNGTQIVLPNDPDTDSVWFVTIWVGSTSGDGADGNYSFNYTTADYNDAGTHGDVGNWFQNALEVGTPCVINGSLSPMDYADFYKFKASKGDFINVTCKVLSLGYYPDTQFIAFYLEDFGEGKTSLGKYYSGMCREGQADATSYLSTTEGSAWYYLIAWIGKPGWSFMGVGGNYRISISVGSQNDAGSGSDAPGSGSEALGLVEGTYGGVVGDADDKDVYKVFLTAGEVLYVRISLGNPRTDAWAELFDDKALTNEVGKVKRRVDNGTDMWSPSDGGYYYVTVRDPWAFGNYTIQVIIDTTPPNVTFNPPGSFKWGENLTLVLEVTDDHFVERALLAYRVSADARWNEDLMDRDGSSFTWTLLAEWIDGSEEVQYYIEVVDAGNRRVLLGSEDAPLKVGAQVPKPDSSDTLERILYIAIAIAILVNAWLVLAALKRRARSRQ